MKEGKPFVIFQFPNKYLWAMIISWPIYNFTSGWVSSLARVIFVAAAIIWSYEEIAHGANWLRKLLGAVVMVIVLRDLFMQFLVS